MNLTAETFVSQTGNMLLIEEQKGEEKYWCAFCMHFHQLSVLKLFEICGRSDSGSDPYIS